MVLSRGHASRAFCCLYSRNLASATGSSGLGVAVSRLSRSTDDVLPRTVGARAAAREDEAKFSPDGRRACSNPGGPAVVATGGRDGRRPDGPAAAATVTPAGATIPGGADGGGGATTVEPDGPATPPAPFVEAGTAGARGGSGDARAAAVARGPGADPSRTGATADSDAAAAAGVAARPGGGVEDAAAADDAAGPEARRTVEYRDSSSPSSCTAWPRSSRTWGLAALRPSISAATYKTSAWTAFSKRP